MKIRITDTVRYHLAANNQHWHGVVTALETYRTAAGETEYAYVRWIDADGRPINEPVRVGLWEIEHWQPVEKP